MADHDSWGGSVNDGDTMSDGWFNGAYEAVANTSTGHEHDGVDSKKIAEVAYLADNEIITGSWTFQTSSANTIVNIKTGAGDYDSVLRFTQASVATWDIFLDDSDNDNLKIRDILDTNNIVVIEQGGDFILWTDLAFGTTSYTIAGVKNIQMRAIDQGLKASIFNAVAHRKAGTGIDMYNLYAFGMTDDNRYTTTGSPDTTGDTYVWSASGTIVTDGDVWEGDTLNYGFISVRYDICETYDEFDDASINGSLWTNSTSGGGVVQETGGYLECDEGSTAPSTAYAYSNSNLNSYKYFRMKVAMSRSGGQSSYSECKIQATDDGTNFVDLFSESNNSSGTYVFKMTWNSSDQVLTVYKDGIFYGTVDCSSLTTSNLGFRFYSKTITDSAARSNIKVYYLRRQKSSPGSTITTQISADGGSNYRTFTQDEIRDFINTGTAPKAKITINRSGAEYISIDGFGYMVKT